MRKAAGDTKALALAVGALVLAATNVTAATVDELRAKSAALVGQMTVDEKCAQLRNDAPAIKRLGIPAYNYWNEALHGIGRNGRATMFPMPIGMAASFDPELVREVADAIATEGRVKHAASVRLGNGARCCAGLSFWSPNINIFRDPRWGRGMETWGEDPYLTGEMGTAFVKGLQGDDPVYLKAAACAKHFAVHSGPEAQRHTFNACPSKKDLYETYLPAFEKLVRDGRVEAVMSAYNRVYGDSATASEFLLKTTLRDAWGFKGHVVSDCGAVCDIWRGHKIVKTPPEAAALAIRNGLTFECGPCFKHLKAGIEKGYVTMNEVDAALTQLLLTRFKLGILGDDPACPYNTVDPKLLCCDRHRELARKMARESMVLVKNSGVLPLDPAKGSYAVVGAGATDVFSLMGNYYGVSDRMVSYLEGVTGAVDAGTNVSYCPTFLYGDERHFGGAPGSGVIIAVVGLTGVFEGEEGDAIASARNGDRTTLDLPAEQMKFLARLQGLRRRGRKVVAVVTGGSPMALKKVADLADAVVLAWYAGEEGGNALADLLFGKADFTGRLPLTFPESLDVLPPFEDYTMNGRTYRYQTNGVSYAFGYGLSYATFACANVEVKAKGEGERRSELVSVEVKNTGKRDGVAVVQLYVSTPNAGKTAPIKSLVGFCRVSVKAGETSKVDFNVLPRQLMEYGEDGVARRAQGECSYSVQL